MGSNPPPPIVVTADDGQCQETPNTLENKGETDSDTGRSHAPNTPPIVQADDCDDSANVHGFDKPDDKLILGHVSTDTTEIYLLDEVKETMKVAKQLDASQD